MSLSRILLVSVLLFSSLYSTNSMGDRILQFEKERFSNNKRIKVEDLSIILEKKLPLENWYGYLININVNIENKSLNVKDIVFTNGKVITHELVDIDTKKSLKDLMTFELTKDYYNKSNLIEGNENAKNKIVVFSDPLCPFCINLLPKVIKYAKDHKDISLYYYNYPLLQIHPASKTIVEAMVVAKSKGVKDIQQKVYLTNFKEYFSVDEKDEKKILNAFNKIMNTNITLKELRKKDVIEKILKDMSMGEQAMVLGTPTIFINGKQDKTLTKYKKL